MAKKKKCVHIVGNLVSVIYCECACLRACVCVSK